MKTSEIRFKVELDNEHIPEKIVWEATDKANQGLQETKAVSLSIWDNDAKETLKLDLWTKDMTVAEMKRFYLDIIGGLAQSLKTSTNDDYMAEEIKNACIRLGEYLKKQTT